MKGILLKCEYWDDIEEAIVKKSFLIDSDCTALIFNFMTDLAGSHIEDNERGDAIRDLWNKGYTKIECTNGAKFEAEILEVVTNKNYKKFL